MKYTKKQIKKAFLDWHTECRLNPSAFKTIEECNTQDIEEVAENDTKTLINYIKK